MIQTLYEVAMCVVYSLPSPYLESISVDDIIRPASWKSGVMKKRFHTAVCTYSNLYGWWISSSSTQSRNCNYLSFAQAISAEAAARIVEMFGLCSSSKKATGVKANKVQTLQLDSTYMLKPVHILKLSHIERT